MAESTRPPEQPAAQPAAVRTVSRTQQAGEPPARQRDATDKVIQESLAKAPETPTPTQAEADAIKEAVFSGNLQPEEEGERRDRERRERDVKPADSASGYTTR
jgi:hypothetical protein